MDLPPEHEAQGQPVASVASVAPVASRGGLTLPDWLGVASTALAASPLFAVPWTVGTVLHDMYTEFGGELPVLTQWVLSAWFAPLCGLITFVALGLAVAAPVRLAVRRLVVIAAFGWVMTVGGVVLIGLYLPMFSLAETISQEPRAGD